MVAKISGQPCKIAYNIRLKLRQLSWSVGFACLVTLPAPSFAQNANAPEGLSISLKGADIRDLIHWADLITDKTIIIHPAVKGKVTVISGENLSREEAYQVFLSTLQIHGYAIISTENTLKVVPAQEVKGNSDRTRPTLDQPDSGEAITTRIIEIKHTKVEALANIAKSFLDKNSNVAMDAAANKLVLSGRKEAIDSVLPIIRSLDTETKQKLSIYPVRHNDPKGLLESLKVLMEKGKSKLGRQKTLMMSLDKYSSSILISGEPELVNEAMEVARALDDKQPESMVTTVKHLNFVDVKDVLPTVKAVMNAAKERLKSKNPEIHTYVEAIENQNAMVLSAPSQVVADVYNILERLDVRKKQVFVEALIVEVNEDINRDLGIEWQANGNDLVGGFSAFGSLSPLSLGDDGSPSLGSGLSIGYVSGSRLKAIINALAVETNANILSTPTLMALDNEEAEILVGENVPFITGTENRAGSDPFQTISRQDIGVTLKVKPKINFDKSVTLDIEQKVESIGQTTADTADIITNKREIKTRVLIDNGDVLVLGGLIRDEVIDKESRVPVLGDIPLLGHAFRNSSTATVKRNLMVFIHPVVISDRRTGNAVSEPIYNDMRTEQRHYNRQSSGLNRRSVQPQGPELPRILSRPASSQPQRESRRRYRQLSPNQHSQQHPEDRSLDSFHSDWEGYQQ